MQSFPPPLQGEGKDAKERRAVELLLEIVQCVLLGLLVFRAPEKNPKREELPEILGEPL